MESDLLDLALGLLERRLRGVLGKLVDEDGLVGTVGRDSREVVSLAVPRDLLGRSGHVDDDEETAVALRVGSTVPANVGRLGRGVRRGTGDSLEGGRRGGVGDAGVEEGNGGDEDTFVLAGEERANALAGE